MELDSAIVGTKLSEIQKKPDEVKLVFENSKTQKTYVLKFKGLLLETSSSTLNRRVKNIQFSNTLGFRATTQLRHLQRDPKNYRQLFIEMEGSDEKDKFELLGILRSYKVLPRVRARTRKIAK